MDDAPRVLIVGAFPAAKMVVRQLRDHDLVVETVDLGPLAFATKRSFVPDLVLIATPPSLSDAHQLITSLARDGDCKVVVIPQSSGKTAPMASLSSGTHVCLRPQATSAQIASRVLALLPLSSNEKAGPLSGQVAVDADLGLLISDSTITRATPAELTVLSMLLTADGAAVSRRSLYGSALSHTWRSGDRGVDSLVFTLRRKLVEHGLSKSTVLTVPGIGYCIPEPSWFLQVRHFPVRLTSDCLPPRIGDINGGQVQEVYVMPLENKAFQRARRPGRR